MTYRSIPLFLVTGFLGSGKTTFLKQIIDNNDDKKIAIIQNEFAPANVDGIILKHETNKSFDILEINKGSVFCVCLLSDFISSLAKFIENYTPDIIFLEASGLSDPIAIGQLLNSADLRDKTFLAKSICIVDAHNFLNISGMVKRINHQIRVADEIMINKIDLAEEKVSEIIDNIKQINPFAGIYRTTFCDAFSQEILAIPTLSEGIKLSEEADVESCGRPNIYSVVFRTNTALDRNKMSEFIKVLSGKCIRSKGTIKLNDDQSSMVQTCFTDISVKKINAMDSQTELIAMGFDLNAADLKKLYMKYI